MACSWIDAFQWRCTRRQRSFSHPSPFSSSSRSSFAQATWCDFNCQIASKQEKKKKQSELLAWLPRKSIILTTVGPVILSFTNIEPPQFDFLSQGTRCDSEMIYFHC